MPLSYSSYYVYDTGNGCLPCEVNGAIFFLLWCRASEWKFLSCVSLKHGVPSPLNGTLPSPRSYQDSRTTSSAPRCVCGVPYGFPFFVCLFLCMSVCLYLFPSASSRHLHPSFFKFTYLCLITPLHTFLNSLRLYPCHVNNWWPVFDWSALAKGWPESWGQHQCRVKSTTATCAPACLPHLQETLFTNDLLLFEWDSSPPRCFPPDRGLYLVHPKGAQEFSFLTSALTQLMHG